MASPRRDHLVDTALKLFCERGFHATGIDTILAESGVAKMTLYNHFRSKDELIIAALQKRDEQFMVSVKEGVERLKGLQDCDPRLAPQASSISQLVNFSLQMPNALLGPAAVYLKFGLSGTAASDAPGKPGHRGVFAA